MVKSRLADRLYMEMQCNAFRKIQVGKFGWQIVLTILGLLCAPLQTYADTSPSLTSPSGSRQWYVGGALGFYRGGALSLPMMSTDGKPLHHSVGSSLHFAFEAAYLAPHMWGVNCGFSKDSPKQIKNASDSVPAFVGIGGDTEISVRTYYLNALYRWQQVYVPFGLNFSEVSITQASVSLERVSTFPGLQGGIGYFLNEHLALEALLRLVGIQARFDAGSSSATRTGFLIEQLIAIKGYF